jgi:diguanylate cyclase (GGDEF)-like protein
VGVVIVGADDRAASVVRLLADIEDLVVLGACAPNLFAPMARAADEAGIHVATDVRELWRIPGVDIVLDLSDGLSGADLDLGRPPTVEVIAGCGAEFVWDLLAVRKEGQEQSRLYQELQVAYESISSQERRLQAAKEALERANSELEHKLAEIFFTHEFFKALTRYTYVDDIAALIVDGANGILGAEISGVYLLDQAEWVFRLQGSQGRPEEEFVAEVPVDETILGSAFESGFVAQPEVAGDRASAGWLTNGASIASQAAVPLRSGERVTAVLVSAWTERHELDPAQVDRLRVIASQASLALHNALLHEELERLSVTDRLTELYNHGYFQQRLEEELERASRFGRTLSLIMLDIDNFKQFNDRWGHPRGDTVLRAVSAVIRQNLREIDVAARYGGEEFIVVLPETDEAGALAVAERIRRSMAEHEFDAGEGAPVAHQTVSLGVATYPTHGVTAPRLVEAVDAAMYEAKRRGKNQVAVAR